MKAIVNTKLDKNNPAHQLLMGVLGMLVDDFGYSPRELFMLLNDCKNLYPALSEMHRENKSEVTNGK